MTLYELSGQWLQLLELAENPDEDPQVISDTFEAIEGEIEYKAEGCVKVMRALEGEASVIKEEEKRLANRRKALETNVDRMKRDLFRAMKLCEMPKIKTDLFTLAIKKNPPAVVLNEGYEDLARVPVDFLNYAQPTLNKKLLMDNIKAGDPEALKVGHLEQAESLSIR